MPPIYPLHKVHCPFAAVAAPYKTQTFFAFQLMRTLTSIRRPLLCSEERADCSNWTLCAEKICCLARQNIIRNMTRPVSNVAAACHLLYICAGPAPGPSNATAQPPKSQCVPNSYAALQQHAQFSTFLQNANSTGAQASACLLHIRTPDSPCKCNHLTAAG